MFDIENRTKKNISRRLIIENSWLDKADITILHNEQLIRQLHLGDSFPFAERIIVHRFFAFDHDYAQGISQLFIRVETPDPMVLPIYFGTLEDSVKRDVFNGYSYGLLYGIVTALLLYNFILYIQLRLRRYLFYVMYLAMFILMNQSYTGHAFYLFWPESVLWQQWMNPFLITLYACSRIGLSIDVILLSIALAAQFRHLQDAKQLAEQLARIDPLTGLFNRRAFYEAAEPILHNSLRYNHSMSVIIFDIDKFKLINDQYGHNFGDEVIKFIAEIIQKIKRKSDVSVRWGGEEFVILLPETGIEQARVLAERLRSNIKTTGFKNSEMTLPFTVSLGVSEMSEEINSIEQLIKLADTRLYQAKENGRNQVR